MFNNLKHGFTKEWLHLNHYKLYMGDKQILDYEGKTIYDFRPSKNRLIDTTLYVGLDLVDKKNVDEVSYEHLVAKGFKIVSVPVTAKERWKQQQKVKYIIVLKTSPFRTSNRIPPRHKLYQDSYNKRIILWGPQAGPKGYGEWVNLEKVMPTRERRKSKHMNPFELLHAADRMELKRLKKAIPYKESLVKAIKITEPAFMISDAGEIVCLDLGADEPVIGFAGQRGKGKSMGIHRFVDIGYHEAGKMVMLCNDEFKETSTWNQTWQKEDKQFLTRLAYINERSVPLPIVHLHPFNPDIGQLIYPDKLSFPFTIPFDDFIEDYNNMTDKTKWEQSRAAALRMAGEMKESLLMAKDLEETCDIIDQVLSAGDFKSMAAKMKSVWFDLYQEKILDKMAPQFPSKWTVEDTSTGWKKTTSPFLACMIAGLVPCLITENITHKDYRSTYFSYLLTQVFKHQYKDPDFIKNQYQIWVVIDELSTMDQNGKETAASQILRTIAMKGRPNRIGMIWATQHPEIINKDIYDNTTIYIALGVNNNEQASNVAKNFNLSDTEKRQLLKLGPFEAIAKTTGRKFVVYDREGNRTLQEGPIKGTLLPPLSQHKAPRSEVAV